MIAVRAPSHLHTPARSSSLTRALQTPSISCTGRTHSPTQTRSLSLSLACSRSQQGRTHSLPLARTVSLSPVTKMQSLQEMHRRTVGPAGFFQSRGCNGPGTNSSLCRRRWESSAEHAEGCKRRPCTCARREASARWSVVEGSCHSFHP